MSEVNKGFLNFVNKKKYIKSQDLFDTDNISEKEEQETDNVQTLSDIDIKFKKPIMSKQKIKENEIIFQNVTQNDNNINDGSLKSLLERFSGKVIEKELPKVNRNNFNEYEEEESEESESESEKNSDSEGSDYEQEQYNHFIKNKLDLVESTYEKEIEEEDQLKIQEAHVKNSTQDKNSFDKIESEIFVDNIPTKLYEKQIIKFFKNLNDKIARVKVLKDQNGYHKGKAYLKFNSKRDALELMKSGVFFNDTKLILKLVEQNQNNQSNPVNIGRNSKIEFNDRSNKISIHSKNNNKDWYGYENQATIITKINNNSLNDTNYTLFLRNLPSETDENVIKSHLKKFGKIKSVRLMKNNSGKIKNFGYVDFLNSESVDKALKSNDQIIIEGKQVVLEKAKSSFIDNVQEDSKRLGKKKKRTLMNKTNE